MICLEQAQLATLLHEPFETVLPQYLAEITQKPVPLLALRVLPAVRPAFKPLVREPEEQRSHLAVALEKDQLGRVLQQAPMPMAAITRHDRRRVEEWRDALLSLSAQIEAVLDFDDEDDVGGLPDSFWGELEALREALVAALAAPAAELLREGYRVALAGPPNAGKSTLFNALVDSEAAITAPVAGTTRDVLTRPVAISGIPFTFVDMAGLRDISDDAVEAIGIERATAEIERADLVLWLGSEGKGPAGAWEIEAQCDRDGHSTKRAPRHRVSAVTGENVDVLKRALVEQASAAMPRPGESALNRRQREWLDRALTALRAAGDEADPLLVAEALRQARVAFDRLVGRSSTEEVLDALFGRFCIGK